MAPKILIIGATGYIGGEALRQLIEAFPTANITALIRDYTKASIVTLTYPSVTPLIGSYKDAIVVKSAVQSSDIIIHLASAQDLDAVKAIHAGLQARTSTRPAYWIQISGASALAAGEYTSKTFEYGTRSNTIFDDWTGIDTLKKHIRSQPVRAVENYLVDVAAEKKIKTAVIIPSLIYGEGTGPVNTRSIQLPEWVKVTLQRKSVPVVSNGESIWGTSHVSDVGALAVALTKKAAAGEDGEGGEDVWGENGFYVTGFGDENFISFAKKIAVEAKAQGYIPEAKTDNVDAAMADKLLPHGAVLFGTNARTTPGRAAKVLGWGAKGHSFDEELKYIIGREAKALGL